VKRESKFLNLCSTLLASAIEDSRREMDDLAVELIEGDGAASDLVVTKLQSIDRLMQRLGNVNTNLKRVEQFLELDDDAVTDDDWQELLIAAKAMYTMAQERELFDQYFSSTLNEERSERSPDTELHGNVSLF